jgi:predicted cobalt transporter CbtA
MSTRFRPPPDDQWNEAPRGGLSRLARNSGWFLLALWGLALVVFTAWTSAGGEERWFEPLVVWGGIGGFGLLLLSVLMDRLRVKRTDRYREVEK